MIKYFKAAKIVLGMSARNLDFIRSFNSKKAKQIADNKLLTKKILNRAEVPVPRLYSVIRNKKQLDSFAWDSLPNDFVLKPNMGFGGEGIMVLYSRKKNGNWVKFNGQEITINDLRNQINDILDGRFSLSGDPDTAFFEERLKKTKKFRRLSYKGTPDIRIIIFNKVPIMAMLRLPTQKSGGKANLHQGGIGVGVDIATGVTTTAIYKNKVIENIPGTLRSLRGVKIPHWNRILNLAVRTQVVTNLGYLGADIVIDRDRGPVLLEINARPGLAIQNANLSPLLDRLQRVRGLKIKTVEKGIRVAKDLFGGEIEQEIEEVSGKQVLGIIEKAQIFGKVKPGKMVDAKIDTGAGFSSIDENLARQLGFTEMVDAIHRYRFNENLNQDDARRLAKKIKKEAKKNIPDLARTIIINSSHGTTYRPMITVKLILSSTKVKTDVSVMSRENLKYPMIIGRRDLKKFLVDPEKNVLPDFMSL